MDKSYIFTVGKPDFGAGSVDYVHALGFKAGLLLDTAVKNPKTDGYDTVISLDFNHLDEELQTLKQFKTRVAGLLCTYENYILSKAKLGEYFGIPAISEEAARLSTDKALMRRAFEAHDPNITPAYATVIDEQSALDFAQHAGYPVIIKPTNLVKSLLVIRCDTPEDLAQGIRYAQTEIVELYKKYRIFDRLPQHIIEQFITGPMYSIAAYVDSRGNPYFAPGVVELTPAQALGIDDNYLYRRQLPATINQSLEKELFDTARSGINALALKTSAAHIELIAGPSGVKLVEIGARTGGYRPRMYHQGYEIDLVQAEVNMALDRPIDMPDTLKSYVAVYELFPLTEGDFIGVNNLSDELRQQLNYCSFKAQPGQRVGPAKNGYKACVVIIVSESDKDKFSRLCGLVDTLSVKVSP